MDGARNETHVTRRHTHIRRLRQIMVVIVLGGVLLLISTGIALTVVTNSFQKSRKIAKNVLIEGIPVGGKSMLEATDIVEREWVAKLPREVELRYPGGSLKVPREQLGVKFQLEEAVAAAYRIGREGGLVERIAAQIKLRRELIHIEVDCAVKEAVLDATLADVAAKVNKPPINAKVEVSDDDQVNIRPHVVGLAVNLEKSKRMILEALQNTDVQTVELVVEEQQPDITSKDLAHLETVLASYSTEFNPGQVGRTHNLRLATAAINGTVVMPGEIFSINEIVGERNAERGYQRAPIFREGGELQDDYGGGLCQVASTLFNAALRANMKIVERSQHNRKVDYVPLGLDAMVNYGSIDMRWRNSLSYPVLVLGRVEGSTLTFKIIGSKSDRTEVKIERSNVGLIPPPEKEIKDPNLEEGKRIKEKSGWSGGHATAWRMTKIDGKWVKTWSASSHYPPGPMVYRVGTKPKPEKKPEPKPLQESAPKPIIPTIPTETPNEAPASG
ncbi:MAG: VanW family protein [Candidatus Zipacnadales bacterium]